MNDLATMLKQQMENDIGARLDAAVATGDAATARKMAKQFADLQVASVPKAPTKTAPTKEQIMSALTAKADWFGIDPVKSALAGELGKTMLPERFESADAFADALLKAVDAKLKTTTNAEDEDGEGEDAEDEDGEDEGDETARKPARRNATAQTELNQGGRSNASGTNLRRAFETGEIKHLSKPAADAIKAQADKFTTGKTKEQRAAYIANAVKARARADAIAAGKFDATTSTFK
jgi:hypothetical protein